jgi:hydroxymethylglutaryl-CoA reductase
MAIEESSVVAAASRSAKFWSRHGGFHAVVIDTKKIGNIHFLWTGDQQQLEDFFHNRHQWLRDQLAPYVEKMEARGGGIRWWTLLDESHLKENLYKLQVEFETCDAMGANFINTCLEKIASLMEKEFHSDQLTIIMSILSNYTEDCVVSVSGKVQISELRNYDATLNPVEIAKKLILAYDLAFIDKERAVTHNKGIMNGVDAVVLATGNDFRATSACAHAFAANDGHYRSLSFGRIIKQTDSSQISEYDLIEVSLKIPLALGTVGGLTRLHPLSELSLNLLGNPSARELMTIVASVGLAQNFAAVMSLVTSGIQKGHMKLHLLNILNQFGASQEQKEQAKIYFKDKVVSTLSVREFLKIK